MSTRLNLSRLLHDGRSAFTVHRSAFGGHNVNRDEGAATEFLIVDTPPRLESKEVRESVRRADLICIPMRPSPMDFGVTTNTAQLVKMLKRADSKAFIILNQLRKGTYWSKKVETLSTTPKQFAELFMEQVPPVTAKVRLDI